MEPRPKICSQVWERWRKNKLIIEFIEFRHGRPARLHLFFWPYWELCQLVWTMSMNQTLASLWFRACQGNISDTQLIKGMPKLKSPIFFCLNKWMRYSNSYKNTWMVGEVDLGAHHTIKEILQQYQIICIGKNNFVLQQGTLHGLKQTWSNYKWYKQIHKS